MQKVKSFIHTLVANDSVRRVFHTFWQAAGGILLAQLLVARSAKDVYAAVVLAGAAGFAAVKALWVARS